jgi:dTDP-glucose 4,6-dehydratase
MKTALVAGGAGFVGSHLCEYLLERGYRVYAIDCLITGRRENIEHLINHERFSWIDHDIIRPLFMNVTCDEIYNLASPASPIDFEKIPEFILNTASHGHLNLLKWALQNKARILYASTSEIYGDPEVHPQREDYLGNVDCDGPRGCYDEAKRFGEALTMAFHRQHKVDTRIVRIFNTYGPRMRPEDGRVIPNFFSQALTGRAMTVYGDGNQTRSLCFVSDLVDGIFKLMQSSCTEPVNLGNDQELTILELARTVAKICKVDFKAEHKPLPQSDPKQRRPDISKAQRVLGWSPKVDLQTGLQETLTYFKKSVK